MVLLIEMEAICQNAGAYSPCFMLDLQAILTGFIKTNVHTQAQRRNSKFQWGDVICGSERLLRKKPQRDKENSRQHPALSFISTTLARSTFQTYAF